MKSGNLVSLVLAFSVNIVSWRWYTFLPVANNPLTWCHSSIFQVTNGRIYISPVGTGRVCVNGLPLQPNERKEVHHNDRIIMGMNHVFLVHSSSVIASLILVICQVTHCWCRPPLLVRVPLIGQWPWRKCSMACKPNVRSTFTIISFSWWSFRPVFDRGEQQRNEDEYQAKMDQVRQKESELEKERSKYQKMLQEIEVSCLFSGNFSNHFVLVSSAGLLIGGIQAIQSPKRG